MKRALIMFIKSVLFILITYLLGMCIYTKGQLDGTTEMKEAMREDALDSMVITGAKFYPREFPVVDPRNFGAKCDGKHSDAKAFFKAEKIANERGGVVLVPDSCLDIHQKITFKAGTTYIGEICLKP